MAQVAEVRGLAAPEGIEAGTVARADARDLLEDALSDEDREAVDGLTALYRLMGTISKDDDYAELYLEFASRAVIGFYEPSADRFWVVDGGSLEFEGFDATLRSTVAHEFVHALQDEEFDLGELLRTAASDPDWALALSAVIEGDAVYHERLWARDHLPGSDVGGTPLRGTSGGRIPAALERELRFPYEAGLDWVALVGAADGNEITNAALRGERISTAEILHPQLRGRGWQAREVRLPGLTAVDGSDWKRVSGGTLGEFRLRNLLQLQLAGLQSVAAAEGWNGDRYAVYRAGDDSVAVVQVVFASASDAGEFEDAMDAWFAAAGAGTLAGPSEAVVLADGRAIRYRRVAEDGVLLLFGSGEDITSRAAAALEID